MSERLLPEDIPIWFVPFARHVLRACSRPGKYQIVLEVPSKDDQCREITIYELRRLRLALVENSVRPRIDHQKLRRDDVY